MSFAVAVFLIVALIIIVGIHERHQEIKEFNNGKCSCGGKFREFDMTSQGHIGWQCDRCKEYIWTSWINPNKLGR